MEQNQLIENEREIPDALQIYSLIPKIMGQVGAIAKERKAQTGGGGGYQFRGIDDLYLALQKPLSQNNVFYVPQVLKKEREERQSKSGAHLIYTILTIRFIFYAPDGSSIQVVTVGEAMDSGDKSCNKAMSAALKYALLQLFCIPTEEEKDTEYETHEVSAAPKPQAASRMPIPKADTNNKTRPSDKQLQELFELCKKKGWDRKRLNQYFADASIGTEKDMTWFQWTHLVEALNRLSDVPKGGGK